MVAAVRWALEAPNLGLLIRRRAESNASQDAVGCLG